MIGTLQDLLDDRAFRQIFVEDQDLHVRQPPSPIISYKLPRICLKQNFEAYKS
jgi:hypothetical protein